MVNYECQYLITSGIRICNSMATSQLPVMPNGIQCTCAGMQVNVSDKGIGHLMYTAHT